MTEEEIMWREEVIDYLGDYWKIEGRPDLFNAVVDYVLKICPEKTFNYTGHYPDDSKAEIEEELIIVIAAFKFLQTHCISALSSDDLEFMAEAEEERRKNEQSL